MKELNGRELAGFVKERQAHLVRSLRGQKIFPKLLIIRDSDNPVIVKYVNLKKQYGEDIGVTVVDKKVSEVSEACDVIRMANADKTVSGIIVQLPLLDKDRTDEVVNLIAPEKDVDGLSQIVTSEKRIFESATATAINWLLAGHGIELADKKVALVGRGRLVGAPLERMWKNSGVDVTVFRHDSDLSLLKDFDVVVSATGVPHLIKSEMVSPGAVIVDAGTASEGGVLVGDIDDEVRKRSDIFAITPKIGGVGPLTVSVLFEDVISASQKML
ncbi:bifunctional 5,10-methylenetetrahydrofolate dehydrogenase/5,10-methenyltetrahydrofolate cyclohydrolase [Candidatus Saccharibacteria bacterium]|nr:bifunctional 5,10-methylenetetrahydrofolate dehydrogenase/5,10-methenyltetrahydrofolate cyclohydrolase [Candidatus Saccharibacteria bacterium]